MTPAERLRAIHELAARVHRESTVSELANALREIVRLSEGAGEDDGWTRCDERKPNNARTVHAQTDDGFVYLLCWLGSSWTGYGFEPAHETVVAWHELPDTYELPAPPKAE